MANDIAGSQLRVYVTPKPVILTATLCQAWSPSQRFGLIALWHDGPAVPTGKKPSRRDGRCEGPQHGHYRVTRQETCTSILRPDWVYYPAGEKRRQRSLPSAPRGTAARSRDSRAADPGACWRQKPWARQRPPAAGAGPGTQASSKRCPGSAKLLHTQRCIYVIGRNLLIMNMVLHTIYLFSNERPNVLKMPQPLSFLMGQSQVATGEKPHTLEQSVREGGEEGRGDEGRQQKRGADRTADANITPCSVSSKSQVGATHHWARAWILIIRAGFFFSFPTITSAANACHQRIRRAGELLPLHLLFSRTPAGKTPTDAALWAVEFAGVYNVRVIFKLSGHFPSP